MEPRLLLALGGWLLVGEGGGVVKCQSLSPVVNLPWMIYGLEPSKVYDEHRSCSALERRPQIWFAAFQCQRRIPVLSSSTSTLL
jgi:hypothetical protein